jgi:hypothetical protein
MLDINFLMTINYLIRRMDNHIYLRQVRRDLRSLRVDLRFLRVDLRFLRDMTLLRRDFISLYLEDRFFLRSV